MLGSAKPGSRRGSGFADLPSLPHSRHPGHALALHSSAHMALLSSAPWSPDWTQPLLRDHHPLPLQADTCHTPCISAPARPKETTLPYIPTQIRNFTNPPGGFPNPAPASGHNVPFTLAQIQSYAASAGSTHVLPGGPALINNGYGWRTEMIASGLTLVTGPNGAQYFRLSDAFKNGTPDDRGHLAYNLGVALCAAMAGRYLGAVATVHIDSFLELIGRKHFGKRRPDLVGFSTNRIFKWSRGAMLLEAKGTSRGFDNAPLLNGKGQLNAAHWSVLNLVTSKCSKIVTLAYFGKQAGVTPAILRCHMEDPPIGGDHDLPYLDSFAFGGLVLATQLLPFALQIQAADATPITYRGVEYYVAEIDSPRITVGIPKQLFRLLSDITWPVTTESAQRAAGLSVRDLFEVTQALSRGESPRSRDADGFSRLPSMLIVRPSDSGHFEWREARAQWFTQNPDSFEAVYRGQ